VCTPGTVPLLARELPVRILSKKVVWGKPYENLK
jgi:hypothetical protein